VNPLAIARRLRGRSTAELRGRTAQAVRVLAERAGLARDLGNPTAAEALAELADPRGRPFATVEAAHAALTAPGAPVVVPGLADRAATLRAADALDPAARGRLLAAAERCASGHFDLLGYEGLSWGTPIDWHLDPVAGRRAPRGHWATIPFLDAAIAGDHKVTWEVNRHQWLVTLAQAWWLTGDERWAERALAEIDAWIEANPVKDGINWASMLEVAFRSISWCWVLGLVRDSRALTPARHVRIAGVLARAGRHVADNLSTWFSPNTHLTGEALALVAIGTALPQLRDARRLRAHGAAVLAEWLPQHVRADGTYVEQATWYARYTADFLVHAIVMTEGSGQPIAGLRAALDRAATFLLAIARRDGQFAHVGDDDGGRFMALEGSTPGDLRSTLGAAAAVLGRADLAWAAGERRAEAAWLLGAAAVPALASAGATEPRFTSRAFADGGVYVLRDGWGADASVAVVDCGEHGFRNGGHAHADLLAVDLVIAGREVVRDPGTWTYTVSVEERAAWRSAARHAAVTVDGTGSATPASPFTWAARPAWQEAALGAGGVVDLLHGTHDGFAALGVRHARTVVRTAAYWLVLDALEGSGAHELVAHFPLAPGVRAEPAAGLLRADGTVVAHLAGAGTAGGWRVDAGWQSPAYGARVASETLAWASRATGGQWVAVVLAPPATGPVAVHLEAGGAVRVTGAAFEDLVLTGADAQAGDVAASANVAWMRRGSSWERPLAAAGLGVSRLAVGGRLLLSASAPVPFALAAAGQAPVGAGWTPDALELFPPAPPASE
jgi:hypothetical protein